MININQQVKPSQEGLSHQFKAEWTILQTNNENEMNFQSTQQLKSKYTFSLIILVHVVQIHTKDFILSRLEHGLKLYFNNWVVAARVRLSSVDMETVP